MTPYQRGNRDGLLNAAAWAMEQCRMYEAEGNKIGQGPGWNPQNPTHVSLLRLNVARSDVCLSVHLRLLALAEALPDDPEDA